MKLFPKALLLFTVLFVACQNKTNEQSADTSNNQHRMGPDSGHEMGEHRMMTHSEMVERMSRMSGMMVRDLGAADSEYDLRFIDLMIPHHEGAVEMAKDALGKAKHDELKKMCESIIKSQNAEIEQMKQWRKAWYNK